VQDERNGKMLGLVMDLGLDVGPHQPEPLAAPGIAGQRRLSKAWVWQPRP